MKFYKHIFTVFLIILLFPNVLLSQIDYGGTPLSFKRDVRSEVPEIEFEKPDMKKIRKEDSINQTLFKPYRFATHINTSIDFSEKATWEKTSEGWIGRLAVSAKEAKGLILYYNQFHLPKEGRLFLYTENKKQVLGSYTHQNNPPSRYFANEMVHSEKVIMEFNYSRQSLIKPDLTIYEIGYVYRGTDFLTKGFGDSEDCMVNINCSEGGDWQDQKRGVVRIAIKNPEGSFWCSGSLVNNTRQNITPYMLTADHCAGEATENDLDQWMFFFNYEAEGCSNPSTEPEYNTMIGAEKRANGGDGGSSGSDFYLVELNQLIPNYIDPYYNGWSNTGEAATSGVGIHHPSGDIKKISTFTNELYSTGWPNSSQNLESHWRLSWSETENGHGVTEGGSSGSPLFNESGLIVGTLTGGLSTCEEPFASDYYGKFSYSWDRNGNTKEDRLRDWLDPDDTGVNNLSGLSHGEAPQRLKADFEAEDTTVVIGDLVSFTNESVGAISSYQWSFPGGAPSSYSTNDAEPVDIQYNEYGYYDVELEITGPSGTSDTLLKDYIHVIAKAYPNPVTNTLTLDFGTEPIGNLSVWVYNSMGYLVDEFDYYFSEKSAYELDMTAYSSGIYLVRVKSDDEIAEYKIMKRKQK